MEQFQPLDKLEFNSNDMLVISDLDKDDKLQIIFDNVANCYGSGPSYTLVKPDFYGVKYSLISSESRYKDSEIILTYEYQDKTMLAAFN